VYSTTSGFIWCYFLEHLGGAAGVMGAGSQKSSKTTYQFAIKEKQNAWRRARLDPPGVELLAWFEGEPSNWLS